jgi:hypothetical protein
MRPKSRFFWLPLLLIVVALLGGCLNPALNLRPAPPPDLDEFKASLIANLVSRNYAELQTQMSSPFVIASWQGAGQEMTPADAMAELQRDLFDPATQITFVADGVVTQWLGGADPLTLWPETVNPVAAIGIAGLGADGMSQAILIIAAYPDGSFSWYAALVAPTGFDGTPVAAPEIEEIAPEDAQLILPSTVTSVLVVGDIGVFAGPGPEFLVIGTAQRGDVFPVVGASADGQWWAVICPQQSSYCWITANPTFVQPQQPVTPIAPPTSTPTAAVPPGVPQRINLGPGESGAVVSGVASPELPGQYLLFAATAQRVFFLLDAANIDVNFSIRGVADGVFYKAPNNLAREFAFTSTRNQDYLITVTAPTPAPFTLAVTFTQGPPPPTARPHPTATPPRPTATPTRPQPGPERITFAPGSDTATRSGPLWANTPRRFVFNGRAGQTATIHFT